MKLIKENISIYENDDSNNYKNYYIYYLKYTNKQLKLKEFKKIELKDNLIICRYKINDIDKDIRILNSYEEAKKEESYLKGKNNEKEIKNNCRIYINENKIDFCYKYKFDKKGKYNIKYLFIKALINGNFIFYKYSSLTSFDLSNFNTNKVINMSYMFYNCSSLTSLNLFNFNTINEIWLYVL